MMKQKHFITFILALLTTGSYLPSVQAQSKKTPQKTAFVDLFVSSAGDHGQLTPSATLPFGLVKLGAETDPTNQAGYDYLSKGLKGFTINRVEGTGCKGAGGNILVKPGLGTPDKKSYAYVKESEKASPGYYEVSFQKPAIKAALTVTNGTGWQQYTYQTGGNAWIMIDLANSLETFIGEDHLIKGQTIEGSVEANTVCKMGIYKFYYHIDIDRPADSVQQKGSVIWYFFKIKDGGTVNVKTSVSSISPAQALNDRELEIGKASFAAIRGKASDLWNKKLGVIAVTGKEEYVKLFYTHYYHALLSPYNLSGPSGNYRGSDGNLYNTTGTYYHGWSMWDNFKTEFPLLTLTEPDMMNDVCRSLVALYQQGKKKWATKTEPFPTVRTEHAIIVLLDCYRKGINKFDLQAVYPLLVKEAALYPHGSPDQQLETAYDYWALGSIATILGKKGDALKYQTEAGKYRDTWQNKFMTMNDQSDIMHGDGLYEGTIWQYRWCVPFDVAGMMNMLGSNTEFTTQLEYFFEHHLYNHTNEPDINVPYLFNTSNKPYLTQKIVNQILTKPMEQWYATHFKLTIPYIGRIYQLDPVGFAPEMDDDVGAMSSWYVLSALGIYPACVGEPVYYLTAPLFTSATIQLPGRKTFKIVAKNVSDENFYIQKTFLNGKELKRCWITHEEITKGGTLVFELGPQPNIAWGTAEQYITQLK